MDVQGKTVCVTGKFNDISRKEIELELARRGAKVAKSVTGKTEILIAGERAGSKLAKAKQMGISIVDEASLLAVLKQEATVEVAPPKPKVVAVPEGYSKKAKELFEGKNVCMTGKLNAFKRAELKALITSAGGKVSSTPNSKTDIMISGYKWGSKLRDAIHHGASIWSEGELLLLLGYKPGEPTYEETIPNAEALRKLPVLEEGEMKINTPGDAPGELVLKWVKVALSPHQRFLEEYGFEFAGPYQWVGDFYYNGTKLSPGDLASSYGRETWHRSYFWEDGSDFDDDYLKFDGEHGFNCSLLSMNRKRLHVEWKNNHFSTGWRFEQDLPTHWYGDVCSDCINAWYTIDLEKMRWCVTFHTGPYIIRPENPYGR